MTLVMYILSALTVATAVGVIASRTPLNSALWLIVTLFLVAGHFALMGAHFVAATQILVYAGAIMVLVVFVIMLLGIEEDKSDTLLTSAFQIPVAIVIGGFMAMLMTGVDSYLAPAGEKITPAASPELGNTEMVGQVMFTKFMYPFEVTSLLLLAAIIGAVLLAYQRKRPLAPGRGLRAKQVVE